MKIGRSAVMASAAAAAAAAAAAPAAGMDTPFVRGAAAAARSSGSRFSP
jgi:hypothetical protein